MPPVPSLFNWLSPNRYFTLQGYYITVVAMLVLETRNSSCFWLYFYPRFRCRLTFS
uniref:Uncharacterized protein n=1 Tax=Arundo donax TaxID=35708 RepID=A0A0A9G0G7_ARUDO